MEMKTIWKYVLTPEIELEMPVGAQILSVHADGDGVSLWALVCPDAPREKRRFVSFTTGDKVPQVKVPQVPMQFHGAAHLHGGEFVFHVFELVAEEAA